MGFIISNSVLWRPYLFSFDAYWNWTSCDMNADYFKFVNMKPFSHFTIILVFPAALSAEIIDLSFPFGILVNKASQMALLTLFWYLSQIFKSAVTTFVFCSFYLFQENCFFISAHKNLQRQTSDSMAQYWMKRRTFLAVWGFLVVFLNLSAELCSNKQTIKKQVN